jgi:hypothetical protein
VKAQLNKYNIGSFNKTDNIVAPNEPKVTIDFKGFFLIGNNNRIDKNPNFNSDE